MITNRSMNDRSSWWILIVFVIILLLIAPTNSAHDFLFTHGTRIAKASATKALPTPSPSPSTTASETKRPNPLRRFFASIISPFRRSKPPVIVDPPIVALRASPSVLVICLPNMSAANCSSDPKVELSAGVAMDPEREFVFTWTVPVGRVVGEGHNVNWELNGVAAGIYTASVEVDAGNQLRAWAEIAVTVVLCPACADPPPCPSLLVSCPSNIDSKQQITFEANVTGADSQMKPTFNWQVTAGKIISGQGTAKITVEVSNLADPPITATVTLGGADPSCPNTASCTAGTTESRSTSSRAFDSTVTSLHNPRRQSSPARLFPHD